MIENPIENPIKKLHLDEIYIQQIQAYNQYLQI